MLINDKDKTGAPAAQLPGGGILAGRLLAAVLTALYGRERVINGSMEFIEEKLKRGAQPLLVVVEEEGRTLGAKEIRKLEAWAASPQHHFNVITICGDVAPVT